jgi:hypothetical protein
VEDRTRVLNEITEITDPLIKNDTPPFFEERVYSQEFKTRYMKCLRQLQSIKPVEKDVHFFVFENYRDYLNHKEEVERVLPIEIKHATVEKEHTHINKPFVVTVNQMQKTLIVEKLHEIVLSIYYKVKHADFF